MPNMPDKDTRDNIALGVAGVGAASPFAGLIGQRRLIGDPRINKAIKRFEDIDDLSMMAQPGDILLSSEKGMVSPTKAFQTVGSGSEYYHTSPVVDRVSGHGKVLDTGSMHNPKAKDPSRSMSAVRRGAKYVSDMEGTYDDFVLLRPDKPLTPEQIKKFQASMASRAGTDYSTAVGRKAFLKDLFLPKFRPFRKKGPISVPVCEGGSCSSVPASALGEAGIIDDILKGKAPQDVLPADFMRAGSGYTPIGAVVPDRPVPLGSAAKRALARYGLRAGIGLGIGGSLYGAYKEPEAAIGVGAGMMTPTLARMVGKKLLERKERLTKKPQEEIGHVLPKAKNVLKKTIWRDLPEDTYKTMLKRFGTRTAPIALAGGLGAYGAARGLGSLLSDD